jgi:glycosyltransferase involved in cell wall biosynthesis
MRLLLLNQFYPPDVAATGQLLAELAKGLAQRGHEVHVICSRGSYSGKNRKFPRYTLADGVHVHRVNAFNFGRAKTVGRLADYLSFYVPALLKAVCLPRTDICVSLTTPPFIGLIAVLLRKLKGTQFVLWVMDVYPEVAVAYGAIRKDSLPSRLCARLSRLLYSKAAVIVSLGKVMTEKLVEAGAEGKKIATVHNWAVGEQSAAEQTSLQSLRQRWSLNGEVVLMYSGNLGLGHDLETVIKAVGRLRNKERLRLLIIGKGKGRAPLEKLSNELGLNCVEFHDPVPLEELWQTLAAGDIHIVAQKQDTEGLIVPSKLYGILAAGRPVLFVGPEHCEAAKIISQSRCGVAISCGNCAETAKQIGRLMDDAELRNEMGKCARQFYENQLGRERSVSKICEAIESAL